MSDRINKKILALITTLIAAIALTACGESEAVAAAEPTATPPPTPTQVVIEVTAAPIPTKTPVPIDTPEPVATLKPSLTDEQAAKLLAETLAEPKLEFPTSLIKGSEPLDDETVLEIWNEYITGSRVVFKNFGFITEFCANGRGRSIYEVGTAYMTNAPFDWNISSDPGSSWHSVRMDLYFDDIPTSTRKQGDGQADLRIGFASPMTAKPVDAVHKSPDCA